MPTIRESILSILSTDPLRAISSAAITKILEDRGVISLNSGGWVSTRLWTAKKWGDVDYTMGLSPYNRPEKRWYRVG